ncbi:MAG: uracil-DNA glycosylase [Deferrisomatales bacterium]
MSRREAACFRCRHFYVTWDPTFPRGCRALGFKSRELPCDAVRGASGAECLHFAERPPRHPREAR